MSSAGPLLSGSWGCSEASMAGTGLPWNPHPRRLLPRAPRTCLSSAGGRQSLPEPCHRCVPLSACLLDGSGTCPADTCSSGWSPQT